MDYGTIIPTEYLNGRRWVVQHNSLGASPDDVLRAALFTDGVLRPELRVGPVVFDYANVTGVVGKDARTDNVAVVAQTAAGQIAFRAELRKIEAAQLSGP